MDAETTVNYAHIIKPNGDSARLRRLPRIRVAMIVESYLAHGYSPQEMCRQFPHLRLSEAYSAMAYYFDHQPEIDDEIAAGLKAYQDAASKAPPSPFRARLREPGAR